MSFSNRIGTYTARVEQALGEALPPASTAPARLHEAMRYAVLGGGKRIRPLLVYATGEALGVPPAVLDGPAVAIELMHAFSLIHDDLPAMDDDDLRRGRPATHRAFDEATAILAADALQPLAFHVLANAPGPPADATLRSRLVALLAEACGTNGIAGGQLLDLMAGSAALDAAEIEHICRLKTGRLLRASVLSSAYCGNAPAAVLQALEQFADALGIAYQIRDDILDITEPEGGDGAAATGQGKANYPGVFGIAAARERADALLQKALAALGNLGPEADGLRWMAQHTVLRDD